MNTPPSNDLMDSARRFLTTRWTVVLSVATEDQNATAALEELCRAYWFPVYAFIRRQGYSPGDAEDLTQGFFLQLIDRHSLTGIRREGGRFRSFLLASVENFLTNDYHRRNARKRGGGRQFLPLDAEDAEGRYGLDAPEAETPESLFEKRWAFALLRQVAERLAEEYQRAGKGELFDALRNQLPGQGTSVSTGDLGTRLQMTEGAVKVAIHRLKRRFGDVLRQAVADTVTQPEEIDAELRHLIHVVSQ